ncbi:hypothetical protein BD560DRAFT_429130 [Blakeslea trispora]|nr:hypothetical protein BD560DRAFT_429130 [Blakeslea trispora]
MSYHLACSCYNYSSRLLTHILLITLLNDYSMMKPNGYLKQTKFTSDLLKINPMNDKIKLRALWMIKGSLESITFFERHSNSPSTQIPNLEYLKFFVYTIDLPSLKIDFQCLKLAVLKSDNETFQPYLMSAVFILPNCWNVCYSFCQSLFDLKTLTATTSPSPCAHVASVMVMRDLKIDIQPRS